MKKNLTLLFFFLLSQTLHGQSLETVIQKGHELAVLAVAVSPDSNYIASASRDKSAKLWEVRTGREVRSFLGHEASVTCVGFSADGKLLITGSNDKTVRLWDVATGKELYSITTPGYIRSVQFDPQSRFFIHTGLIDTGDGDSLVVYDFKTKQPIAKISVSPDKGLGTGTEAVISNDG